MQQFIDLITDDALVVIPALWIIGAIMRRTPKIKNWIIPYVLLAAGVAITMTTLGVTADAIVQGVLVTGAAVFSDQLVKQGKNGDNGEGGVIDQTQNKTGDDTHAKG